MTILALIALVLALLLAIVNTRLEKKNESLERITREYANRLSHEIKLKEQCEVVLAEQTRMSTDFARGGLPKKKVSLKSTGTQDIGQSIPVFQQSEQSSSLTRAGEGTSASSGKSTARKSKSKK